MHQIFALWSHPRSMSTAMERVMRERGDLFCFHEPFMYDYYVNRRIREMPHFDIEEDHPKTYEDVRNMLLGRAEEVPVFFKDMSYYVMPQILEDREFSERLTHCFLIRDPISSIPSYYKLDAQVTLEEIGLEAQWQHYEGLLNAGHDPVVVEAEAIRDNPKCVIGALWAAIGLSYEATAFEWKIEKPKDWSQVSGWHGDVSACRAIRPLTSEEQASQDVEFRALAKVYPHLEDYLIHHRTFYERLRDNALHC